MNNNLGWIHALGIGFDIPPEGQRHLDSGNGPYTELMHNYELWLRDEKGIKSYNEKQDFDQISGLRQDFS